MLQNSGLSLPADSQRSLDKIIVASTRMKTLIIDILSYSRLSANQIEITRVNMTALSREILEDLDLRIAEREAKIQLDTLPIIEGNTGQLRQVLYNIINNALKFIPQDRKPEIVITE